MNASPHSPAGFPMLLMCDLMHRVTREHREGLAKSAKMIHDKAKTRLRDIHNKYVKKVKAAKDYHSEDIVKGAQDMVRPVLCFLCMRLW